jgi:hypothetical protein
MAWTGIAVLRRQRRFEGLGLLLLAAVLVGLAFALWPKSHDSPATIVQAASVVHPMSRMQPAALARTRKSQEAKPAPTDEQRRRLLVVLLMNGGTWVGPYGRLAR